VVTIKKSEDSEYASSSLDPDLPQLIGVHEFLEVLDRNNIEFFNELEYPGNFFCLLALQQIKELFNWGSTRLHPIKMDFSHT